MISFLNANQWPLCQDIQYRLLIHFHTLGGEVTVALAPNKTPPRIGIGFPLGYIFS